MYYVGGREINGCRLIGIVKVELARERFGGGMPRDGRSARLLRDGTYEDDIHSLWWERSKVILCKTKFCSGLRDFPPSMA